MSVKEKYNRIQFYEKPLNEVVRVIEIIDPIRNDTNANNWKSYKDHRFADGEDIIQIPVFKAWLVKVKEKLFLKVHRKNGNYEPITLELSRDVVDSISQVLCDKRDFYREMIKKIDSSE